MTKEKGPYRPNVGIVLLNQKNEVFLGRRTVSSTGDEYEYVWQMPQGGITDGEDVITAAKRELFEETSVCDVEILYVLPNRYRYDFPDGILEREGFNFVGQEQSWVVMRFTGDEAWINLNNAPDNEFCAWRWGSLDIIEGLIVPFKRGVYKLVLDDVKKYLKKHKRKS